MDYVAGYAEGHYRWLMDPCVDLNESEQAARTRINSEARAALGEQNPDYWKGFNAAIDELENG